MSAPSSGLGIMLAGYLLLGTVPVLVRLLRDYGLLSSEVVAIRFFVGALLALLIARAVRAPLRTRQLRLLILRGVLGAIAVQLYFAAIQLAGAGVGTLLNYTYPVWANVLGALYGHRPSPSVWWLLLLALGGMFLVVDPTLSTVSLGELAGLLSAVVAGASIVCIKKLRRTDGELVIVLSFCTLGTMLSLPTAIAQRLTSDGGFATLEVEPTAWLLLILVAALSFAGHVLFTRGYKETSIQAGSLLSFSVPLVAAALGAILLGETWGLQRLAGAGLILTACFLTSWQSKTE